MAATTTKAGQALAEWFEGKTLAELRAVERGRDLLFQDKLVRRGAGGAFEEEAVLVKVPDALDLVMARKDAVAFVAELAGDKTIKTVEAAQAVVGASYFEMLDNQAIVSRCLFCSDRPAERYMLLELLVKAWPRASVQAIFDRLEIYQSATDVRMDGDLTEDDYWRAVAAIAKTGTVTPLAVMAGYAQRRFVTRMAADLMKRRTPSS